MHSNSEIRNDYLRQVLILLNLQLKDNELSIFVELQVIDCESVIDSIIIMEERLSNLSHHSASFLFRCNLFLCRLHRWYFRYIASDIRQTFIFPIRLDLLNFKPISKIIFVECCTYKNDCICFTMTLFRCCKLCIIRKVLGYSLLSARHIWLNFCS